MKNALIVILVLAVLGEGYLLMKKKDVSRSNDDGLKGSMVKTSPPPRMPLLTKGAVLKDSPIFKFAYNVSTETMSDDTKKALIGFKIDKEVQKDSSVKITFTPKDSDDQSQQYVVKPGETLYFIEQTPLDDNADKDKDMNLRDDYGVIVDQNGIVQ